MAHQIVKIVVTGPECSGKSTLVHQLAAQLQLPLMEEVARSYLNAIDRKYTIEDLIEIANQHIILEDQWTNETEILLLDTDLLTIEIWAEDKFGLVPLSIIDAVLKRHYDHYLLCVPEMPWQFDPLRENPDDRERLFQLYEHKLKFYSKSYTLISGTESERLTSGIEIIKKLIS